MKTTVLPANMLEIAITEPGGIDKLQPQLSPIPPLPPTLSFDQSWRFWC